MRDKKLRLLLCVVLVTLAACSPQQVPAPVPSSTPAPPTVTSLPLTITPAAIPPGLTSELDQQLTKLAQQGLFNGSVLVCHQGTVLLSQGYGLADREQAIPNTSRTRFRIGSLTKQFTAMAFLILEAQNKLCVTDSICVHLADCPAAWKPITIHQLLTHTSGIPNFTGLPGYLSTRATPLPPGQTIDRFKDLPLDFQPGENWSYSNSGYILLGSIIEQASGRSYEDFLQDTIFTPLNLREPGYDHNPSSLAVGYADRYSSLSADAIDMSIPFAAGGLYSTVEYLHTWEKLLSTEQLIPQEYLERMFAPQASIPGSKDLAYGYGWAIGSENGHPYMGHTGGIEGFTAIITRYPEDQITIIVLSNQQNSNAGFMSELISQKIFGDG